MSFMNSSGSKSLRKKRIVVADDHPLFREALIQLINRERELACCEGTDSIAGTLAAVARLNPDLLVLDLRLKDGDGLELTRTLSSRFPDLRILVLSQHDEALYAERALRAGARGYVMKEEVTEEILNAIRMLLKGELYVSRKMSALAVRKLIDNPLLQAGNQVERLTNRELQVFQMIGAGMTTRQIAHSLRLSYKTVETHRENIKHKLNVRGADELLRYATLWKETESRKASARV
jgi:DNA-binding NarL/FixJ family response regulator